LIAVFVSGEQFSWTSKAFYYRPIHNIACCQKSGGVIGRLFRVIRHQIGGFCFFPKLLRGKYNHCGQCTASPPPHSGHGPTGWAAFGGPQRLGFLTELNNSFYHVFLTLNLTAVGRSAHTIFKGLLTQKVLKCKKSAKNT
jgi:hypothetical protein